MRNFYFITTVLFLMTSAQAVENTITTDHFKATLLGAGETKQIFREEEKYKIEGVEPWTDDHREAIRRSLETLERSFDFSGNPTQRKMEIAFVLEAGPFLGASAPSIIFDNENLILTGEKLLRDGQDNNYGEDVVDDAVWMFTSVPLYFGKGIPGHGLYDFETTVTHEIVHAMGIMNGGEEDGSYPYGLTKWDTLLEDINGNNPSYGVESSMLTTGEKGTVFWIGEHANTTYGRPVSIQTFVDLYLPGSSISHPALLEELMNFKGTPANASRELNKLQLDMFRDMGWSINMDYYNSFGPTFYGDGKAIVNNENFTTTHSNTYAMHVNGNNNMIEQNATLITTKEQSKVLSVHDTGNQLDLKGKLQGDGDYSVGLHWQTRYNAWGDGTIAINSGASIEVTGQDSIGLYVNGYGNKIYHSGSIRATEIATTAIRLDNPLYLLEDRLAELHIQRGATIEGNIINSNPEMPALMTFGREYDGGSYTADDNFSFTYNNTISGLWDYDFHAGATTFTNDLVQQEGTTIKGNGTVIGNIESNGIIAPGNSIGTLTITGDLTQSATSDLQIEFDNNGSDQIIVNGNGNVTLGGSLTLIPIGYIASDANYNFIIADADSINGTFTSINNPSVILQTSLSPTAAGTFSLTRNTYQSISTPAQSSLAKALDLTRHTATGDMSDILNSMDLMNLANIRTTIKELSPNLYNSVTTATLENIRIRTNFLQDKIKRNGTENKSTLWFSGYDGSTSYDYLGDNDKFKSKYAGFMLGGDKQFPTGFSIGAATGYTDLSQDVNNSFSSSSASVYDGYLYGSWQPQANNGFYLESIIGVGVSDTNVVREISMVNMASRKATSNHVALHYSTFVGSGYDFIIGKWNLEPRLGFEYIKLAEDSFTESGAGDASLAINSKDSDALVGSFGFDLSYNLEIGNGLLVPKVNAEWSHNFSAAAENTTANLQSGEFFHINGIDASRDTLGLGVGLSLIASEAISGDLGYQYTIANNQDGSHLLSANLNYSF